MIDQSILVYWVERLASHWPAEIPEANPSAKKPILAAHETSFHITTDKDAAITSHMIESLK